jgi:hypothetical protein
MKTGEKYVSKFKICNDDARYFVLLEEYLGNDLWKCEFGIIPDTHPSADFMRELAGSTIKGDIVFKHYEKVN